MKVILYGILAFAAWSMLTIPYYVCNVMELCDDQTKSLEVVTPVEDKTEEIKVPLKSDLGNLVFNWETDLPITNQEFLMIKDSLANGLKDSMRGLVITGKYYSGEQNNTTYDNLGLARASAVRKLLVNEVYKDRIEVSSQIASGAPQNTDIPFLGVAFDYKENEVVESDFTITEEQGKIVINFPVASADPTLNSVLDERMSQLAEKVIESDANIVISGHTDNTGSTEQNYQYGLARANAIKNLLVTKAVKTERISVESKGETMPIADNETDEGKRQNRRVEIVIN